MLLKLLLHKKSYKHSIIYENTVYKQKKNNKLKNKQTNGEAKTKSKILIKQL